MTKLLSAAALMAAIAIPTTAIAGEATPTRSFTRDGQTYVYTAVDKGDATVLTGRSYPSGRDFALSVRGNRVNGYSGGVPVSFTVDATRAATTVIASR